jgi:hypothetical protein
LGKKEKHPFSQIDKATLTNNQKNHVSGRLFKPCHKVFMEGLEKTMTKNTILQDKLLEQNER